MGDEASLNTTVIQSYDPLCTTIIDKSSSVHLYTFHAQNNSWVKTKIGGVLFLYKRSKLPFHSFMILNRKSPNVNQMEFINSSLQIQLHSPFMLYKTSTGIFSLWFFSPEDCLRISERIGQLVLDLGGTALRVASSPNKSRSQKVLSEVNTSHSIKVTQGLSQLLSIIRRSGEVDGVCVSDTLTASNQSRDASEFVMSGTSKLDQPRKSTGQTKSPNVFELLHKAEADFNSKCQLEFGPTHETNINSELRWLLTACNIPSVGSKEQTAKAHSAAGIVSRDSAHLAPPNHLNHSTSNHISVAELEQRLLREHATTPNSRPLLEATDGSSNDERHLASRTTLPKPVCPTFDDKTVTTSPIVNVTSSTRLLSDLDTGYADDIDETYESDSAHRVRDHGGAQLRDSSSTVQRKHRRHTRPREGGLPTADQAHHLPTAQHSHQPSHLSQPEFSGHVKECNREEAEGNDDNEEVLVTPAMLSNSISAFSKPELTSPVVPSRHINAPVPLKEPYAHERPGESGGLSKEQLRDALTFMLQNDDDFLNRIHSAYLMSLRQRLSKL